MCYTNNGDNMYEYIKSLLKFDVFNNGKKTLIKNFSNIIDNGEMSDFLLICQDKKIAKIIIENDLFWTNIKILVNKDKKSSNIINCIKLLYNIDKNYILNNINKLLDVYPEITLNYIEFLNSINYDLNKIIIHLKENDIKIEFNPIIRYILTITNGKKIITDNIDYFINNNHKLLELKKMLDENSINSDIDNIINNNRELIIEEMINNKTKLTIDDLKKENLLDELKKLVDSIVKYENKNYSDIRKIGYGSFSDVYQIGNKVIKFGKERKKFNIDRNKLFLQPIYRANIKSGIDKRQLMCIEVTEVVDTRNVNTENLYQVYKKLREEGYVWIDCRLDNIGRLLKDNKIYFDKKYSEEPEYLEKGDIVILDNDFIYTEEEFRNLDKSNHEKLNNKYNYDLIKNFESRYQQEKNIQTRLI